MPAPYKVHRHTRKPAHTDYGFEVRKGRKVVVLVGVCDDWYAVEVDNKLATPEQIKLIRSSLPTRRVHSWGSLDTSDDVTLYNWRVPKRCHPMIGKYASITIAVAEAIARTLNK